MQSSNPSDVADVERAAEAVRRTWRRKPIVVAFLHSYAHTRSMSGKPPQVIASETASAGDRQPRGVP